MNQKMKVFISDLPLKRKIMFILLAVNLLMFGTMATVGLRIITEENNKLLYSATATSLSYSATDLQQALQGVEKLSQLLVTDSNIQKHLSKLQISDDAITRGEAFRQMNAILQAYRSQFSSSDIYYISLYSDFMDLHTDTNRANKIHPAYRESILRRGIEAEGAPVWVQDYCPENGLFLPRAVRRINPMMLDTLGVINICVSFDKMIESHIGVSGNYDKAYYLILDGDHPLYASPELPESVYAQAQTIQKNSYKVLKLEGERFFAVRGTVPGYDWQYISLVSYEANHRAIQLSNILFFAVMLGCFCISALLCNMLVNRITLHFNDLIVKMQTFGENEAELIATRYDYSTRKDEIGLLHRQFDSMAKQIIHYIQIDYTNRLMMKDAQIKALEAQIDPHFLYNVLASINWRAKAIGEVRISQMVQALSKLLRTTLSNADENFTLQKELELVQNYMTIQQIRFEDELCFEINVPEDLMNGAIPKLSLQPLVENAIRYGLEENAELCRIIIEASKTEEQLCITVSNTGSQFEEDLLESIISNRIKPHGFGIGIVNIHQRLRLTFGDQFGLRFFNRNGMAVVQMNIPYQPVS